MWRILLDWRFQLNEYVKVMGLGFISYGLDSVAVLVTTNLHSTNVRGGIATADL